MEMTLLDGQNKVVIQLSPEYYRIRRCSIFVHKKKTNCSLHGMTWEMENFQSHRKENDLNCIVVIKLSFGPTKSMCNSYELSSSSLLL